MALTGKNYDELADALSEIENFIAQEFYEAPEIYEEKIDSAKGRFVFLKEYSS